MPKRDELQEYLDNKTSYAFQKVEGLPTLLLRDIVCDEKLIAGDKIHIFYLPDGKYFISKSEDDSKDAFTVGKITLAYLYLDDDIIVEEK